MKRRWLAVAGFACLLYGADPSADGKRWWSHILYLADDKLEGRLTGSEGYHKAAIYVAGEFERAGLKPGGTSGYFQPVKFKSREIVEEGSSLALGAQRRGRSAAARRGRDDQHARRSRGLGRGATGLRRATA